VKALPKAWAVAGRIVVCAALLAWVFHSIFMQEAESAVVREGQAWHSLARAAQWQLAWTRGPAELWGTMRTLPIAEGVASFAFMGMTIFLGMLRWRMVLGVQGLNLPIGRAAEISLVAHFFNSFLLGSSGGDLMKAYYTARETHHLKTEAVVTVLADRLIGLLSMLLFAAAMMLFNLKLLFEHRRIALLAGVILLMLLAGLVVAAISFRSGLSNRWPKSREWLRRLPKSDLVERAVDAARRFGQVPGFFAKTVGVSMLLNLCCVGQIWALSAGLGITVPLPALLLLVPMIICISALPVTPSGLGVRENLYVWTLTLPVFGIPSTRALSLSLLAYAGSLLWSVIGAAVYVAFRSRHHLPSRAEAETPEPDPTP
jgi:hypothetical protein